MNDSDAAWPLSTLLDGISDDCAADLGIDPNPAKRFAACVRVLIAMQEEARRELDRVRHAISVGAGDTGEDGTGEEFDTRWCQQQRAERVAKDLARALVNVRLSWNELEAESLHLAASAMDLATGVVLGRGRR